MTKEKKQTVVLGALVAVIAAVGAFQFMGPKSKPAAADATKREAKKDETLLAANDKPADPTQVVIDELIASATTPRDPFQPQAVVIDNVGHQGEDPGTTVAPHTDNPGGFQQEIQGTFNGNGNSGGNGSGTTVGGGTVIEPVNPGVPATFTFALRGVMIGRSKKLCILELGAGKQILASEGQSFGPNGETTIVSVTDEKVVLRHRGQEMTLPLYGGN